MARDLALRQGFEVALGSRFIQGGQAQNMPSAERSLRRVCPQEGQTLGGPERGKGEASAGGGGSTTGVGCGAGTD